MLLWLLALAIVGGVAAAGYYAGAIRSSFTFLGLLLAAMLCLPLSPLARPLVSFFDVKQPLLIGLLAPVIAWIVVVLAVRSAGEGVHQKINTYYKYKVSDRERLEWERLNRELGACVGLLNGAIYVYALCVLIYVVGYSTSQLSTPGQDPRGFSLVNHLTSALQKTRMDKAVGSYLPAANRYYDAADIAGTIYRNPLIQSRLASYPVFLALMERSEFKVLSTNSAFQEFWLKRPPAAELLSHELIKPLVKNPDYYTTVLDMLGNDLKDLKQYIETGRSEKYDDIRILGRWEFNLLRSDKLTRRSRPTMTNTERALVRRALETSMLNASLTALLDNRVLLQTTGTNDAARVVQGTWKEAGGNRYILKLSEDGKKRELEAELDGGKMTIIKDGLTLIFEK